MACSLHPLQPIDWHLLESKTLPPAHILNAASLGLKSSQWVEAGRLSPFTTGANYGDAGDGAVLVSG